MRIALLLGAILYEPQNYTGGEQGFFWRASRCSPGVCSDNIGVIRLGRLQQQASVKVSSEPGGLSAI